MTMSGWNFFFVCLTAISFLNYVGTDEVRSGSQEFKSEKLIFPSDLPYHNGPHCRSCSFHNNEGYPPPNFSYNERYPPPNIQHNHQFHHDNQFPPGFKHSPEFHERNSSGKSIRFGDGNHEVVEFKNNSLKEIPINYLEQIDNYDVNDLLANYVDGYNEAESKPTFGNRFGDDGQERNAGMIPAKAGCSPESISVHLASSEDPTVVYIPKCTRIERCGGCCSHKLLSCQAIETETVSVQVVKTQYIGAKKLKYLGKEVIPLEKHLKCKCNCKVKAEHCLPNQQYRASECGCICMNADEEAKCIRDTDIKFWDPRTCTCKCRNIIECSTGSVYDHNECRCKIIPKRRYAKFERKGYVVEKEFIVPLITDDPE